MVPPREPTPPSLDPAFAPLLESVDRGRLDEDPRISLGLWPDLRIGWVNRAWWEAALAGGARWGPGEWGPGDSLARCLPDPLRDFYLAGFARVADSGTVWEHDYECSTPERERTYRMRVAPLAGGKGLLVTHSLRVERIHPPGPTSPDLAVYRGRADLVTVCCHCRRVRRAADERAWDWVPELVELPPRNLSHGICGTCRAYYYRF